MATTPSERQRLLAELSTLAIRDLVQVWRRAVIADVDFAAFLIDAFPEIVTTYATVAADLAADWYELSAPALDFTAVTVDPPDVDVLQRSARWALGADGEVALDRMSGSLQRNVFNGARETTLLNVENEDGASWARHASANACEFCRLLAARGDVYTSERAAMRVVGRGKDFSTNFDEDGNRKAGGQAQGVKTRGTRKVGERYHDNCHCVAIEVRPGTSYEPAPYVADWEKEYREAFDAVPDGMAYDSQNSVLKAVLKNMRDAQK